MSNPDDLIKPYLLSRDNKAKLRYREDEAYREKKKAEARERYWKNKKFLEELAIIKKRIW